MIDFDAVNVEYGVTVGLWVCVICQFVDSVFSLALGWAEGAAGTEQGDSLGGVWRAGRADLGSAAAQGSNGFLCYNSQQQV